MNARSAKPNNGKIYLSGRDVRIEWNDVDEAPGHYHVLFAGDGWLRLQVIESGKQFVTPASNVWRITDMVQERV